MTTLAKSTRYIPVLKWREAESQALFNLSPDVKDSIVPLIEILPPQVRNSGLVKPAEKHVSDEVDRLAGTWGRRRVLVDVRHMPTGSKYPLKVVCDSARDHGLRVVPVASTRALNDILHPARYYLREAGHGVCLREGRDSFMGRSFADDLHATIRELDATPAVIDLVLDLGHVAREPLMASFVATAVGRVPDLNSFRSFTVTASAFPMSLSDLAPGNHRLPRFDWFLWNDIRDELRMGTRLPGFGDYTIVHPAFRGTGGRLGSATIRYTSDGEHVIVRGRSLETYGFGEYSEVARGLVADPVYSGETFSSADAFIRHVAAGIERTGDQGQWIQLGIIHHITFVVRQLASTAAARDGHHTA